MITVCINDGDQLIIVSLTRSDGKTHNSAVVASYLLHPVTTACYRDLVAANCYGRLNSADHVTVCCCQSVTKGLSSKYTRLDTTKNLQVQVLCILYILIFNLTPLIDALYLANCEILAEIFTTHHLFFSKSYELYLTYCKTNLWNRLILDWEICNEISISSVSIWSVVNT